MSGNVHFIFGWGLKALFKHDYIYVKVDDIARDFLKEGSCP